MSSGDGPSSCNNQMNNNAVKCPYCNIPAEESSSWLEYHLAGTQVPHILPCSTVPEAVKQILQTNYTEDLLNTSIDSKNSSWSRKRLKMHSSENGNGSTSTSSSENLRAREAKKSIGRFFYENGTDFEAVKSASFVKMISLGFGPNVQIPTTDELKGWILEESVQEMREYTNQIKSSWARTGCTILLDGWADDEGRSFMNILVDCPEGIIYLHSHDMSDLGEDLEAMQSFFEKVIDEVGIYNVVQIISHTTSPLVKEIGEQLTKMDKYKSIFWTVDTHFCIELMLDKYGAIVNETLDKAKRITRFVYSHPEVLQLLHNKTQGRDLVKSSKTKLSLPFLTLENIVLEEKALKEIFRSSIVASTEVGKRVGHLVREKSFWSAARTVVTAVIPLVRVMEWMNEKKSHMDCLYETMDQVKETIKEGFGEKECKYMAFWNAIDDVWDGDLHSPVHTAGYYLNPNIFFSDGRHISPEVVTDMIMFISRTAEDGGVQELARQLQQYQNGKGLFALGCAAENRTNKTPAQWWSEYGEECPELQRLAIRILSQTCNGGSRFEVKRRLAEKLVKGRRNEAEEERLSEMVFVHYNMQLRNVDSGTSNASAAQTVDEWTVDN